MKTLLMIAALAAAGAAQAQDKPLTPKQTEGRDLFNATCVYCHGPRGYGTEAIGIRLGSDKAEIEKRADLPAQYIRFVVKRGLGNMPSYTPTDLTPGQLDAIVDYLRRNSPSR